MENINFDQCFKGAWEDVWIMFANKSMTILSVVAFVPFAAYIRNNLRQTVAMVSAAGRLHSEHEGLSLSLSLRIIMISVLLMVIAVQMMPYSLLGQELARSPGIFDEGFFSYVGLCFVIVLVAVVFLAGVVPTTVIGWAFIQVKFGHGAHIERGNMFYAKKNLGR
jgi:hypothetical protein